MGGSLFGLAKDALFSVIAGTKKRKPRLIHAVSEAPKKLNLVDIQRKLAQGKGAGYQRWASIFNLKQIAQTVSSLKDHDLMEYDELSSRTDAATAKYNELSAQSKSA